MREDEYLSQFHPDDRPILLIKSKHEFRGVQNPEVFDQGEKQQFFKISENTQVVEDIPHEINSQTKFLHRKTQVHQA